MSIKQLIFYFILFYPKLFTLYITSDEIGLLVSFVVIITLLDSQKTTPVVLHVL